MTFRFPAAHVVVKCIKDFLLENRKSYTITTAHDKIYIFTSSYIYFSHIFFVIFEETVRGKGREYIKRVCKFNKKLLSVHSSISHFLVYRAYFYVNFFGILVITDNLYFFSPFLINKLLCIHDEHHHRDHHYLAKINFLCRKTHYDGRPPYSMSLHRIVHFYNYNQQVCISEKNEEAYTHIQVNCELYYLKSRRNYKNVQPNYVCILYY